MGYQTDYYFEVDGLSLVESRPLIVSLRSLYSEVADAFDNTGTPLHAVKWYDHEEQIKEWSQQFPERLFKLSGIGEDVDDHWIKYFQNGKAVTLRSTELWPKFDESSLA